MKEVSSKERIKKFVVSLLILALVFGGVPYNPFTPRTVFAAQTTVYEENFDDISSWEGQFTSPSALSLSPDGNGIKGNKIVVSDTSGGVQFRTDGKIGLLNTGKVAPAFDVHVQVTTAQALQISMDWEELKNSPVDSGARQCTLRVLYSFDGAEFLDLARDQSPIAINTKEPAQKGQLNLIIEGNKVESEDLYLRIWSQEMPIGGGTRPGFVLDNLQIISTDENLQPEPDTEAPILDVLRPEKGATNVLTTQGISVKFKEDIQLKSQNITLTQGEQKLAIALEVNRDTLKIVPKNKLEYNKLYTVTIPAGSVQDLSGNIYNETISWSFTTEAQTETMSILDARAAKKDSIVQVEGIVVATDGSNFFLQDETAGIAARGSVKPQVGNIVRVKGPRDVYNGLEEISSKNFDEVTITILDNTSNPLPEPVILTIPEFKDSYQGQRVRVEGVTIGKIDTKGNTTLVDGEGNETIIRKVPKLTDIVEGDLVNVTGVLGKFNDFQLFVASAQDVQKDTSPDIKAPVITHTPVTSASIFNDLSITTTVKDNRKVEAVKLYYKVKDATAYTEVVMEKDEVGNYTAVIPKENLDLKGMLYYIYATDGTNEGTYPVDALTPLEITINNEDVKAPIITKVFPRENQKVVNNVRPLIGAEYTDETGILLESVKLFVDGVEVTEKAQITEQKITYAPEVDLTYDVHTVKLELVDASDKAHITEKEWTFIVSDDQYQLFFGQLHAHTAENSDGAGTLQEAYTWARDRANLDFFAVTDHSNSFDKAPAEDKAGVYNLGAYNKDNQKWQNGLNAAADSCTEDFVGVYGYEMTWSGGPGHMNTFNTEGFVSRNNKELNNKTNDAGLRAYYALLKDYPNSISQFNHPGETFGTFNGFAYYDPIIDERISLVEVGNGEGEVGSGGYFRSYDEYNQALDKGWHLAPTNNQDNHKKEWGTANTARTVIYTTDLSTDGLYEALHDMRVYATEDNNLEITYTLNDEVLGTIIDKVPDTAHFEVEINDPDESDRIQSISIISNGGKAIYSESYNGQYVTMDYELLDPVPGYYYIKVVQQDGHIAVTAPIWLGKAAAVGISEVKSSTFMPVTHEALTLTTQLFNNENESVVLKNISYIKKDGTVIAQEALDTMIESNKTFKHTQSYTPVTAGLETIIVTAEIAINGLSKHYTTEIELNVRDSEKLTFVGIDASHFNEYVAGNYKDSMGNFGKLASEYNVRTVELRTQEELFEALENPKYEMMVFTAPSRRDGSTGREPYAMYSDEEIAAIAAFAKQGKTIIIAGWSDYYESYSNVKDDGLDRHMAGQQNKLLQAMGASLRISDDGVLDDVNNGGQSPRLYLTDYNDFVSPLTKGIVEGQVYSNYGGATIHAVNPDGTPAMSLPTSVTPIISGHETTYSKDQDGDGYGFEDKTVKIPKYNDRMLITASETLTHDNGLTSQVIVSGAAFMSNFEIQATVENAGSLNYSNYNILENIIASMGTVAITPIAELKGEPLGTAFTIEGIVTSSVYDGSDNNKGFFDCIYVQDATGGINLFPVSSGVELGQKVRVTGTVSGYQGETQLKVDKIKVVDEAITPVAPTVVSTQEAMAPENTGKLIQTTGKVIDVVKDQGVVSQITLDDGSKPALAYINGYITKGVDLSFVEEGATLTLTGLASVGENFQSQTDFLPRIRVRDRGEIILVKGPEDHDNEPSTEGSGGGRHVDFSASKAIARLTAREKAALLAKVEANLPYTALGEALTIEILDELTLGKFTTKQLEEILRSPKLLESLGIDVDQSIQVITLYQEEGKTFKDVPATHWAYESIYGLTALGIIQGMPDGTFNPRSSLQVADTFTFLDRVLLMHGITQMNLDRKVVEQYVTDQEHWAFAHVASIGSKLSEETLQVVTQLNDEPITRELLAQVLFELTEGRFEKSHEPKVFIDLGTSSYKQALIYCVEVGLLQGTSETEMSPNKVLTRAELATILQRLNDVLK